MRSGSRSKTVRSIARSAASASRTCFWSVMSPAWIMRPPAAPSPSPHGAVRLRPAVLVAVQRLARKAATVNVLPALGEVRVDLVVAEPDDGSAAAAPRAELAAARRDAHHVAVEHRDVGRRLVHERPQ